MENNVFENNAFEVVPYTNPNRVKQDLTSLQLKPSNHYQINTVDNNQIILNNNSNSSFSISKLFSSDPEHHLDIVFKSTLGNKLLNLVDNINLQSIRNSGSQSYYVIEDPRNNKKNITLPCNVAGGWKRGKLFNLDIEMKLIKNNVEVIGIALRLYKMSNLIESQQFLQNLIEGNVREVYQIKNE